MLNFCEYNLFEIVLVPPFIYSLHLEAHWLSRDDSELGSVTVDTVYSTGSRKILETKLLAYL